jgi:uncharacterized protein YdhG (YjbR/CyaY superfamily)
VFSYRMPGYGYPGYGSKGTFAWFALRRGYIGIYLRPPTVATHRRELARYRTTKSAVHLPVQEELPTRLIRKLVRASLRIARASKR